MLWEFVQGKPANMEEKKESNVKEETTVTRQSAVKNKVILVGQELFRKICGEKKPFSCFICNKHFSQKVHVKIHIRSHTGEKPFTCSICNRSFSRNSHLQNHVLKRHNIHTEYICPVCKTSFSQQSSLKRHKETHTEEKPCCCFNCNKKPHSCSRCNKSFSKKYNLDRPFHTHAGQEPPHVCSVCNQSFSHQADFLTHIRLHYRVIEEQTKKKVTNKWPVPFHETETK